VVGYALKPVAMGVAGLLAKYTFWLGHDIAKNSNVGLLLGTEPGADWGPRAGTPRGVVDATGSNTQQAKLHRKRQAWGKRERLSQPTALEGWTPPLPLRVL
jgi:hypothetical protein